VETGLTQAAISQRIGNLEARLGTLLFMRRARGVSLTVEGEAWLPYVAAALGDIAQSAEEMFGAPNRKITILASASVTQLWLAPRLGARGPGLRGDISFATMVVHADYERRDANVDVRYGLGKWEGRLAKRLFAECLSPVCAPQLLGGSKETAKRFTRDWRDLPRIAVAGPRAGWQEWAAFTGDSATPVPSLRFDTFSSALAAAKSGAGVLLASIPLCQQALTNGELMRVSKAELCLGESYWMTVRRDGMPKKQWKDLTEMFCNDPAFDS
jgi:LysR family glycine cleavage system transcriptional activator